MKHEKRTILEWNITQILLRDFYERINVDKKITNKSNEIKKNIVIVLRLVTEYSENKRKSSKQQGASLT